MSLINTRIQNVRASSNLDNNELRPSRYGALSFFMQSTKDPASVVTPDLEAKAEKSIGSSLETPVIDYDAGVTIGNTRTVTIADDENTSQMYTITFATYAWGFTIVPSAFMNNEISIQRDFATKFNKYLYKFGDTLDSVCAAALSTGKTQVFGDLLNYSQTGNAVQVPFTKRETILGDVNPMLSANDHFGNLHVIANTGVESVIRNLSEKGLYNAENKSLQYSDKTLHFSNRVVNDAGEFGNAFVALGGSVGVLTRFERESVLGTTMADGTEWGIETLPMLDFPVGTYFYESKGDFSALGGAATADNTRARKEHYGFAVDVAILTPYNSDPSTIANPILKVSILDEV